MNSPPINRRTLLAGALATAATVRGRGVARQAVIDDSRRALADAARYLWSHQGDDGGWRSPQYGLMRSGQSFTPFVLAALLEVPESLARRPTDGVERGLQFIRARVDDRGALGHADSDFAEYPVYSTAYALVCLTRCGAAGDAALAHRMQAFLGAAQFGRANGFDESHPAFGGWGFDAPRAPGVCGHMDLAHTRRALEALAAANRRWPALPDFRVDIAPRAERFLALVQKLPRQTATPDPARPPFDGGFYFSPVVVEANKSQRASHPFPHSHSYATATCDGVLALRALGAPWSEQESADAAASDPRLAAATRWLRAHDDVDYPQGVLCDPARPWGEAIRYYHYAVRGEAYRALAFPRTERARLAAAVARRQRADGSFANETSTLMKEDCPIMCTALAVVALADG